MTASLTMSVVSRNWSAESSRLPSSIRAHCKQWPENPNSQIPTSKFQKTTTTMGLGFGIWDLGFGIYDRKDDQTPVDRAVDHLQAHVQAEGGGELPVPEGADVPEVPRQAGDGKSTRLNYSHRT